MNTQSPWKIPLQQVGITYWQVRCHSLEIVFRKIEYNIGLTAQGDESTLIGFLDYEINETRRLIHKTLFYKLNVFFVVLAKKRRSWLLVHLCIFSGYKVAINFLPIATFNLLCTQMKCESSTGPVPQPDVLMLSLMKALHLDSDD